MNLSPPDETDSLLQTWEDNYKKGLLSFWMLLLLYQRPTYAFEMKSLIEQISQGSLTADDNSLYRALSRFEGMGLVAAEAQPSPQGPPRRYYRLTAKGIHLLGQFILRNLLVFQSAPVSAAMQAVLAEMENQK